MVFIFSHGSALWPMDKGFRSGQVFEFVTLGLTMSGPYNVHIFCVNANLLCNMLTELPRLGYKFIFVFGKIFFVRLD